MVLLGQLLQQLVQRFGVRGLASFGPHIAGVVAPNFVNLSTKASETRVLIERADRDICPQALADSQQELLGEQTVPAKVEEPVLPLDSLRVETTDDIGPQVRHSLLGFRKRLPVLDIFL